MVTTENCLTARDRVGANSGLLQEYFASDSTKQHFQDEYEHYRKEPASVITKTLVAGVNYQNIWQEVLHMVDVIRDCRNDPDVGLG